MWPFNNSEKPKVKVIHNGIIAIYDDQYNCWSIEHEHYDFEIMTYNVIFDTVLIDKTNNILDVVNEHKNQIREIISKHLEGWADDLKNEYIVSIDVTELLKSNSFDVTYAGGDEWADLGINIIFENNEIISDYSGD